VIDLLVDHRSANPGNRLLVPEKRGLAGVHGLHAGFGSGGDERRRVADERVFVKGTASLIVLHVPHQQDGALGIDDFAEFVGICLPAYSIIEITSMQFVWLRLFTVWADSLKS